MKPPSWSHPRRSDRGRLRERGDSPTIQDTGQASAECLIAPSGRPTRSRQINGFVAVQRAVFAGLTARAGGSRVVEWLVARKEPPSSTVRSRRSSGPRRWKNDRKLSLRVQEIHNTTDGPPDVITLYPSTGKDAGLTTSVSTRSPSSSRRADPLGRALQEPRHRPDGRLRPRAPTAPAALASDVEQARGPRPGQGSRRPSRCDRRKGAGDFFGAVKRAVAAARARWSPASRALSCALAPSARRVNLEAVVTSRQPL
jgi:hypothetical protein